MMPKVKMRLDKLRFSISEGLGFAEGRLGGSVALTAIFRDLEVRAKELEDAITIPDPLVEEAADEIARLRLTDAERSAIRDAADRYASITPESAATAATLRGLLDRTGSV